MKKQVYLLLMISVSLTSAFKSPAQSCPPMTVTATPPTLCAGQSSKLSVSWINGGQFCWDSGETGSSIAVTPSVTTTYTVKGKRGNCSDVKMITVTVNPNPVISVNSGSVCEGQSFTMVPSGANTYTFSSGSAIVTPTANSTYSVTGTSNAGCLSSNVAISSVTVCDPPVLSVNSGSICAGQSFTMIPSGALTYTFSSGTDVVSPTVTTTYSVWGTSAEGCVSESPAISTVVVSSPVTASAGADQTVYYGYPPMECAALR